MRLFCWPYVEARPVTWFHDVVVAYRLRAWLVLCHRHYEGVADSIGAERLMTGASISNWAV